MVLSIALVKLYFTKSPLVAMFFYSILPKINRLPPMSNVNDCTNFEDSQESNLDLKSTQALKMGGDHLENKMADVKFFVPLDPKQTQKT